MKDTMLSEFTNHRASGPPVRYCLPASDLLNRLRDTLYRSRGNPPSRVVLAPSAAQALLALEDARYEFVSHPNDGDSFRGIPVKIRRAESIFLPSGAPIVTQVVWEDPDDGWVRGLESIALERVEG